jgi:hypothetical protein
MHAYMRCTATRNKLAILKGKSILHTEHVAYSAIVLSVSCTIRVPTESDLCMIEPKS